MFKKIIPVLLLLSIIGACKKDKTNAPTPSPYDNDNPKVLTHIGFGSCFLQQFFGQSIFNTITQKNPELFLAIGDMIYSDEFFSSDTHDNDWATYLTMRYGQLGDSATFKAFKAKFPMHVMWDDHDFGMNNAAGDFKNKSISKDVFFKFWGYPESGKRWARNGIYDSYYYGDTAHKIQIILMDLRWDLADLGPEPIAATNDATKHMMSDEQWAWLKEELKKPAKVRILCSTTQFCTEHNGYEAWANFPLEQERMYQTIKDAKADGVFILSGDVHMAEVNKRTPSGMYPLWDFTSSGLAQLHPAANLQPSQYRVGTAQNIDNFGMIDIDWNATPVTVTYTAFDKTGSPVITQAISMGDLKF